jgi:hypothetical protein
MTKAVYQDQAGNRYSCPVEIHDNKWMMLTSDGPVPITHQFQDDVAGPLIFVEYREEPDSRLHVSRLPGESSFGALQRAYAEKEIVAQRKHREAARAEMNNQQPDAAQVARAAQARELNAEMLRQMRPRGKGAFIKNGNGE